MGRETDFDRRSFLLGTLAMGVAGPAAANAPDRSIRPPPRSATAAVAAAPRASSAAAAEALIREANLGGKVAFSVADARSGQAFEGGEAAAAMPPASVAKAITAMYALDALGAGHRFRTRLIAGGPLTNGRLDGDLILVGSGDPTLQTDDLGKLAQALKAAGVREVRGRLRVFDGALPYIRTIDPAQPDHVGYSPAISGLNLNYNRVHFEWVRGQGGWRVGMDARSDTHRPAVQGARMRIADRQGPLFTYEERDGVEAWSVASAALRENGSRWLPVRRPGAYAAEVFAWFARANGIELAVGQPVRGEVRGTVLAEHVSGDLRGILTDMLRFSTNITAEAIGLSASGARGAMPGTLVGSGQRMTGWLEGRAGVRGARFVDHSGLGSESRISAQDMVRALVQSGPDGALRPLLRRIDMRDGNGRVLRDHPARVQAKTGTLNFVSGLAGYVQAPSNRVLSFAIFAADLDRRARLGRSEMENPDGAQAWTRRARALQQKLIERWVSAYGA